MKKLVLFILFSFIYCSIQGQCPQGNIVLSTQLEVDNFAANYPSCTAITDTLSIGVYSGTYSDITDLSSLPPIESIGHLEILRNNNLTNLSGLENLTSVSGDLSIERNDGLTDLSALENLTSVDSLLFIWYNNGLTDLSGLENVTSVGDLYIRGNQGLTDLSGLENVTSVGDLHIRANHALTSLSSLENVTSVGGSLTIYDNHALTNLSGLGNLTSIGDRLEIRYNGLTDLSALGNLTSIGGPLSITYNPLTDLSGLENLTSIGSSLGISNNNSLTDLSALGNLTSIGGSLIIRDSGALTSLSGLENLTSLGRSVSIDKNSALSDISALGNLTAIDGNLIISYNNILTNLSGLENITSISDNFTLWGNYTLSDISALGNLTAIGGNLTIQSNTALSDISALGNLTAIGGSLSIIGNSTLTDISVLGNVTSLGGGLWINNTALTDLSGLENVTSINGTLSIERNNTLTDISALGNVTLIDGVLGISHNAALTDLSGLENVTSISNNLKINHNTALNNISALGNLTAIGGQLSIYGNPNLTDLNGLENMTAIGGQLSIYGNSNLMNLNALGNVASIDGQVWVYNNPILSICEVPFICEYLYSGRYSYIEGNASGCNSATEILDACSFIPRIYTDIFYDLNQNAIKEADELNYYDVSISIMPGDNLFYAQNTGIIFLQPGTYTATFDEVNNPNWELTTMPSSYTFSLDEGESDTITFGIYPTEQISDIQTIINSPPTRCNESIPFDISVKNLGTTIVNGTMWFSVDETTSVTAFIQQPDTTIANTNTYGWYFSDLFPGQTIEKYADILIPGPPDFMLGDSIVFETYTDFSDVNGGQSTTSFVYETEVRCSFDPNDKLVNPNREGEYVLFEEDFIYTIRFQNTGNDVAYDVVIRDTLDANLDRSTFRVLGSSHADRLNTILNEDEGILTFEFRDIFLPDSTSNFDASQGYVNYIISPFDGLAEETPITNSAGIYFDLNPPVITNTTQSIMVSELPTVSTESPDSSFNFNVLPNPNSGIFTVQGIPTGTYQILNTSGQIIQEGNMQNDVLIDISQKARGVYFISVTIDKESSVRRIVKM